MRGALLGRADDAWDEREPRGVEGAAGGVREMTTGRDSSDRLSELAGRLAQLRTAESQDLGLISVAVGAIYAVKSAVKWGYSGLRSTRTQQVHVRKAAEALGRGGTPRTSVYLAGYYFNDSLLRLDIAYARYCL